MPHAELSAYAASNQSPTKPMHGIAGQSRQNKKAAQTGGFPNALSAKSTASADDYIFIAVR